MVIIHPLLGRGSQHLYFYSPTHTYHAVKLPSLCTNTIILFYSAAITVGFGNTTVVVLENATYVVLHVHILSGHLLRSASVDFHTMDETALGMHVKLHNNIINSCCCTDNSDIKVTTLLTVKFVC